MTIKNQACAKEWTITKGSVRLLKNKIERMWIEDNTYINIVNYWWYRYFTNGFRNYLFWYFSFEQREEEDAK